MPVEHWMLFGTFAEQSYFEYPSKGTYRGIVINANMAAYAPSGLGAFLLERTAGVRYVIDPLTHAFQHDPDAITDKHGELKPSVANLAEAYGEPVASLVGKRPVQPEDFEGRALQGFVDRCLRFQASQLKTRMEDSKSAKYLDGQEEFDPHALVAPYFYMTEGTLEDWLPINAQAAKIACQVRGSASQIWPSVVVSQGVVTSRECRQHVVDAYKDLPVSGFLLWVDDLDEQDASGAELRGLLDLASGLRQNGSRSVLNLHGGYFSVLAASALGGHALSGVAHGPEFGEHREVVPVGGGIPIARYYVPQLHSRVRYRDALRMFSAARWLTSAEVFHAEVCDCDECTRVLDGDPANFREFGEGTVKSVRRRHGIVRIEFPTGDTKLRCLRHYLQRKYREYVAAAAADEDVLLKNLELAESKFRDVGGLDTVAHLRLWRRVLSA